MGASSGQEQRTNDTQYFLDNQQTTSLPEAAVIGHRIPFAFVVPEILPSFTQGITGIEHDLAESYLQLPPSIGDCDVAGDGLQHLSDFAPENSRISYLVHAKVAALTAPGESFVMQRKLRIMPISTRQDDTTSDDFWYRGDDYERSLKQVFKHPFKFHSIGELFIDASQPMDIQLPPPGVPFTHPSPTQLILKLRYDAKNSDDKLPTFHSVTTSLNARTYYSTVPLLSFPKISTLPFVLKGDMSTRTIVLSKRPVTAVTWHEATEQTSSTFAKSFASEIKVPIALPLTHAYIPTFFSPYVMRCYSISLTLAIESPKRTVQLKVPVRLYVDSRSAYKLDEGVQISSNAQSIDAASQQTYDSQTASTTLPDEAPPAYEERSSWVS